MAISPGSLVGSRLTAVPADMDAATLQVGFSLANGNPGKITSRGFEWQR